MFCLIDCSCSGITLFVVCVLALFKLYNNVTKGFYHGNERLEGKTAIVTGASAGIGAEAAKDFARRGARVIMLCRDLKKGENVKQYIIGYTGNKNLVLKHIDFSSLASVRKCANEILAEEKQIDILLNNAGAGGLGLNNITPDGMEILMQTNHFGPFLFTNILLDLIKKTPSARIVNVSSLMHKWADLDLNDLLQKNVKYQHTIYSNTKLCNIYFTNALAEKLKSTDVTVNSLHPGAITSEITRNSGQLFQFVWKGILSAFCKNPWEGVQTSIYCCVSPSLNRVTGKYFIDCKECSPSETALDMNAAIKLWELSEKAVKLTKEEMHY